MQIDQEPGEYRVQRPDGSWTQRVDRKLCAILGFGAGAVSVMAALAPFGGWQGPILGVVLAFLSGGLVTLSLRSIDW